MFTEPPLTEETVPAPAAERPRVRVRPGRWLRENLFSSWWNGLLTVAFGALLLWAAVRAVRFVAVTADWEIVRVNLTSLMVGLFPRDQLWRPWAALYLLTAGVGFAVGTAGALARARAAAEGTSAPTVSWRAGLRRLWPVLALVVGILAMTRTVGPTALLAGAVATGLVAWAAGRSAPAPVRSRGWVAAVAAVAAALTAMLAFGGVGWDAWGGLLLTAFVAVTGIVVAFPIGMALALGRRSSLPVVRATCVAYIELIRGVPLITLLLMGQFMLGFFLPAGAEPPSLVVRAAVAIIAFEAAYLAEVVRGGLQSVPRGQYEAAQALGLGPWKVTRLVVLPQALRAVIPATVGQFISLYKDTSLLAIIGLSELLAIATAVTSQPAFQGRGLHAVTLTFAGLVYWAGSYAMARESRGLERRLGVGER